MGKIYYGNELIGSGFNSTLIPSDNVKGIIIVDSDNVSSITIPFSIENTANISVYQDGLLLTPNVRYTATITEITLLGYTVSSGTIFTFVGSAALGAAEVLNSSASEVLFADTTSGLNYSGCNTVQDALMRIANWIPTITSISVNGTEITPNQLKEVAISGVVNSISLNGTQLSVNTDGSVTFPNVATKVNINGTDYSAASNGIVTLPSDFVRTSQSTTMTAPLVAQSNTSYTTKQVRNIFLSTSEPTSSDGENGDIWIVYEA